MTKFWHQDGIMRGAYAGVAYTADHARQRHNSCMAHRGGKGLRFSTCNHHGGEHPAFARCMRRRRCRCLHGSCPGARASRFLLFLLFFLLSPCICVAPASSSTTAIGSRSWTRALASEIWHYIPGMIDDPCFSWFADMLEPFFGSHLCPKWGEKGCQKNLIPWLPCSASNQHLTPTLQEFLRSHKWISL